MTSEDDHPGDDGHRAAPARLGKSGRTRSRAVAGAAGLAAVLGIGAYLTTSAIISDDVPMAEDVRPIAPVSTPSTAVLSPTPSAAVSPSDQQTSGAGAQAAQQERDPGEVRKEVTTARQKAAEHGFPLQRPLEPDADSAPGTETTRNLPGGGTMRITTAEGDLTGQRPLLWAGDEGRTVGPNRCTQSFRFSQGDLGVERPTMLLCWRTSASRSVAVLSVDPDGTPSVEESAKVIDREWEKLS
ncbi:hypothetical protein Ait01nite_060710 [Actinoplanes italicus]|uniref:Uncharacterized protein n=1 Tax=Actinoplanes italicus TaxID=113567 RepID=A0A2T0K6R5_9ACTN|nr:hypothetical protein [Actinoplanes italicus]PRX18685.1 hypothetical protein CLV67_112160 [Actinoplanes italicus]GIE33026.1 hypothetical protein Ait01nite_060710 [Actinoplanes italicus]